MRYFVDLKPYFNFRMAYPKDTDLSETDYIGVHNYFYFQEDIEYGIIGNHEVTVNIERTDDFDCVECNNQIICLDSIPAKKIILAGACGWGQFRENFKFVFADRSVCCASVFLGDWAWPPKIWIKGSMETEGRDLECSTLKEYKRRDGPACIYYKIIELPDIKKIKQIILPDNICMYIFGITLEAN